MLDAAAEASELQNVATTFGRSELVVTQETQ